MSSEDDVTAACLGDAPPMEDRPDRQTERESRSMIASLPPVRFRFRFRRFSSGVIFAQRERDAKEKEDTSSVPDDDNDPANPGVGGPVGFFGGNPKREKEMATRRGVCSKISE